MWYHITRVLYIAILGSITVFTMMEVRDGIKLMMDEIKEDNEKIRLEEDNANRVDEADITNEGNR